ncbi:MAG: hypothetical protein JWN95_3603 [Frankiales bacterium]|nr:hypothetical protein [Frankiales bacterium]
MASDDLGLTRGDGCFEATRVIVRPPDATGLPSTPTVDHLDQHLDRLARSADALAMPAVDRAAWLSLIDQLLSTWTEPGEAILRLLLTRGRESELAGGTGHVTGIATITPISATSLRQRREGISAITLGRGTRADAFTDAPWLLGGVKTLSYAVNVAAARTAMARGADDVIFTSADGFVLEAPTSAVLWMAADILSTTPTGATGILASITQRALFAAAEANGLRTAYALATVEQLQAADGVWLASSGRGVTRVHTLDGLALPLTPAADRIAALSDH